MEILKKEDFKLYEYQYKLLKECNYVEYDNYRLDLKCYKDNEFLGSFGASGVKKSMIYRYCRRNDIKVCER